MANGADAGAAGGDDERRAAWEAAGLYQPGTAGAAERLALLRYLTERGASVDQMVEAHALGALPGVAGTLVRGAPSPGTTLAEAAAASGLGPERLRRILLAVGLPVDDDTPIPVALHPLLRSFQIGAELMGEEAILAFTRVLGAAATNVAEAAVALFYNELGPGSERQGPDEVARARIAERAMLAFSTVPDVLARILMVQFERAGRRATEQRRWEGPGAGEPGGTETVGIAFVDLVGSTAWAESLSRRDHSLALSRFESAAWAAAVTAGGRVVKLIGDEAFVAASSAEAACRIAVEVCAAVAADGVLPPARAAVGYGPVTGREGDYFGPLVNVVSRAVKAAAPGAVVATVDAVGQLAGHGWDVGPVTPRALRGVERPVELAEVRPLTGGRPRP